MWHWLTLLLSFIHSSATPSFSLHTSLLLPMAPEAGIHMVLNSPPPNDNASVFIVTVFSIVGRTCEASETVQCGVVLNTRT